MTMVHSAEDGCVPTERTDNWYAELDSADQLRHIWRTDQDGEPEKVAVVLGDNDDDFDPAPAQRARLIATAPEMLEALKLAEDVIDDCASGVTEDDDPDVYRTLRAVRAAIATATGAEQ